MFEVPTSALSSLRCYVGQLDAAQLTADQAAQLTVLFAEVERVAVGGKLLVAARAAQSTIWARSGHRSAASWLADISGSGVGEAMGALETAERLADLPQTTEAVRRGDLSAAQAREITTAARSNPAAEGQLLESAGSDSFKQLKDRARKVRAAAASQLSQAEREDRVHRGRYLRHWLDNEGGFRLDARLTPTDGAQVVATLESRARAHFEAARSEGRTESEAAYLSDALVALAADGGGLAGTGGSAKAPAKVRLRVDLAALRRGNLDPGEVCEIPGVGPVSLATARSVLGDSFLSLFITDGIDVQSILYVGRTVRVAIRRALEERDTCCVVPGCGATRFLQIDHWQVDYADDGPTELWNLCRLCPHHHRLKTKGAFELLGGPGKWEFRPIRSPSPSPGAEGGEGADTRAGPAVDAQAGPAVDARAGPIATAAPLFGDP